MKLKIIYNSEIWIWPSECKVKSNGPLQIFNTLFCPYDIEIKSICGSSIFHKKVPPNRKENSSPFKNHYSYMAFFSKFYSSKKRTHLLHASYQQENDYEQKKWVERNYFKWNVTAWLNIHEVIFKICSNVSILH